MGGGYEGVIYKACTGILYKSNDYALTYEIVSDPPNCPISDIGYLDGEFYGIDGNAGEGFYLYHSLDYANTYTEIPIDSSIAYWAPLGHWPKISRGTVPGELYLVSWGLNLKYKIFHSVDTGYTWTEKFESEYINLLVWGVQGTAGRQAGSFYVLRGTLNPSGTHAWLYIDHSSDYGETFTTYFHGEPMPQPSNYPENFSAHNIELEWDDPVSGVLPHAYLVLMSDISFEAIKTPIDNVAVPDSYTAKNISYGVEKCIFSNLASGTLYYFRIFPYTFNANSINYKNEEAIQTKKITKE